MEKKPYKTITIRLTPSEYEDLRQIAALETRFLSRQAAYWVRRGIWDYPRATLAEPGESQGTESSFGMDAWRKGQ